MAFTYTTLTATIEDYLQQYDTAFVAQLPTIIRQAEDRLFKATNMPVLKKNATSTCTDGSRFVPAPVDMLSPLALTLIDGTTYTPLIFRESSLIYEMYGNEASGPPVYYSLYSDATFLVGPTPDENYNVEFSYLYKPPSIVDAGTSWLGTNAENALLYACLVEAYTYMKGDEKVMATYVASYTKALEDLTRLGEGQNERDAYTDNDIKVATPR